MSYPASGPVAYAVVFLSVQSSVWLGYEPSVVIFAAIGALIAVWSVKGWGARLSGFILSMAFGVAVAKAVTLEPSAQRLWALSVSYFCLEAAKVITTFIRSVEPADIKRVLLKNYKPDDENPK
jgi:hypothetical protein